MGVFFPHCTNKVFAVFWLFLSLPVEIQVIKVTVFYNREKQNLWCTIVPRRENAVMFLFQENINM